MLKIEIKAWYDKMFLVRAKKPIHTYNPDAILDMKNLRMQLHHILFLMYYILYFLRAYFCTDMEEETFVMTWKRKSAFLRVGGGLALPLQWGKLVQNHHFSTGKAAATNYQSSPSAEKQAHFCFLSAETGLHEQCRKDFTFSNTLKN